MVVDLVHLIQVYKGFHDIQIKVNSRKKPPKTLFLKMSTV